MLDVLVIHMYMHTLYVVYAHSNVLPQHLTHMGKYAPAARCSSAHPNYFMGVVSGRPFYRDSFALKSHWEHQFCPLSGIEKCPFVRGWFCTKAVVISIRATDFVRCRKVVLLSEGPLWEVRLYMYVSDIYTCMAACKSVHNHITGSSW